MSIKENLEEVERRITAAAERSGRRREDITLVAVTKTHGAEMMNEAIKLGVTDIGENKPQEVRDKFDHVLPAKWHLIGHLQTNKVKYVIDKVCLIHSVDSIKLMDEIERQAEKHNLDMDILIQVNISGEETKSGIKKEELEESEASEKPEKNASAAEENTEKDGPNAPSSEEQDQYED